MVRDSGVINAEGCKIPVRSSWDLDKLEYWLQGYADKEVVKFLRYGWPLGCEDPGEQVLPKNHKGAREFQSEVRDYLYAQRDKCTLIGPLKQNPFGEEARFSPLNSREKRDSEDRRIIVDLSAPRGKSINSGTPKQTYLGKVCELHYPKVDDLIKLIYKKKEKSESVKLMKVDLKSAYKQECYDPGDIHLLGMIFDDRFWFDTTLTMGACQSAGCCQRSTNALMHVYRLFGYEGVNFLDDLASAEVSELAGEAFRTLRWVLQEIKVREAVEKASPPSPIMIFLGILLNTILMRMEITPDRMSAIQAEVIRWTTKRYATLRQVQSLIGKLNFCASTVYAGRLFFSRILAFMKEMPERGYTRIQGEVKLDIQWWCKFISNFNGVSCIPELHWSTPGKVFMTDSSLKLAGGWSENEFFIFEYPQDLLAREDVFIHELESVAVLLGVRAFAHKCKGRRLLVRCDNEATVSVINTGRSHKTFTQACMRELHFWCARADCQIYAVFIRSEQNALADLLSRWEGSEANFRAFQVLTGEQDMSRLEIPQSWCRFAHNW